VLGHYTDVEVANDPIGHRIDLVDVLLPLLGRRSAVDRRAPLVKSRRSRRPRYTLWGSSGGGIAPVDGLSAASGAPQLRDVWIAGRASATGERRRGAERCVQPPCLHRALGLRSTIRSVDRPYAIRPPNDDELVPEHGDAGVGDRSGRLPARATRPGLPDRSRAPAESAFP